MRLCVLAHSCLHPRQEALSLELARRGHQILAIGPAQWADETNPPREVGTYRSCPLQVVGGNIFTLTLQGWMDAAKEFKPDMLYCQQEPWSTLASQVCAFSRETGTPYSIFSWENRKSIGGDRAAEARVLEGAAGVVAGNSLARDRMEGVMGKPIERCLIAPQTGIDLERFRPMKHIPKDFDVIFHGRLCREKGIHFIEEACKDLNLRLLIVGGRGTYQPRHYAAMMPWCDYDALPRLINRAKVSATCSWNFRGYFEQWPSAPPDSAACGLQTVITDHGSMKEHYATAPFHKAIEADQESITRTIDRALKFPLEGGREWVQKNMSVQAIAAKLDGFLHSGLEVT